MIRTEELLQFARAISDEGYGCDTGVSGKFGYWIDSGMDQAWVEFDPSTIKQLVELVRLQHFALSMHSAPYLNHEDEYAAAIAAFEKFERGE